MSIGTITTTKISTTKQARSFEAGLGMILPDIVFTGTGGTVGRFISLETKIKRSNMIRVRETEDSPSKISNLTAEL